MLSKTQTKPNICSDIILCTLCSKPKHKGEQIKVQGPKLAGKKMFLFCRETSCIGLKTTLLLLAWRCCSLLASLAVLSVSASFISHSFFTLFTMTCHIIILLLKWQNIYCQRNHAHTDLSNADVLNDATQSWNCGNTHWPENHCTVRKYTSHKIH